TPGEFIARNLYPFCKLQDLPSRKTSSSEERKQHHEAIGPDKTLQRQALHDCFAVSEFLKRVVAAGLSLPVGLNRATVNKVKPTQEFLFFAVFRRKPLYPALLNRSDQQAATTATPALLFAQLDRIVTGHCRIHVSIWYCYATGSLSWSRYSPGTSSSGTWRVVTSETLGSLEFSTPKTTPASNEFPSSSSSSTLSESAVASRSKP